MQRCKRNIHYYKFMAYTKDTLVIEKPSAKLLEALKVLREHKMEQLEKLRNMKPEDFNRRVILS